MVAGSFIVSPDAPFKIDSFDGVGAATINFDGVDPDLHPMMLTVPDGKVLMVTRAAPEPKHRSVVH